jgi:predicted RNA-binding protein YlxR (DUF448 family)
MGGVERICCVCRVKQPTMGMVRVARVRQADGSYLFIVDRGQKAGGRGCFVCPKCVDRAVKTRALNRSFKGSVPDSVYMEIAETPKQ